MLALPSRSYLAELLNALCGGRDHSRRGYLYRFSMPQSPGNPRRLYALTRRGKSLLMELGVEVASCYRPEKASLLSFSFLQHHLAVSEVLVALNLFVRKFPEYELVESRPWFTMAESPPRLIRVIDGKETTITVIPDLWVAIERDPEELEKTQGFNIWFEIDRGTEARTRYMELVRKRINFIRDEGYEQFFGTSSVLLVFLAVGPSMDYRLHRLHLMRQWTQELLQQEKLVDWSNTFLFSTIDETLYDTLMLFTDPVHFQPFSDTLVPLFPPRPPEEKTDETSANTVSSRSDSAEKGFCNDAAGATTPSTGEKTSSTSWPDKAARIAGRQAQAASTTHHEGQPDHHRVGDGRANRTGRRTHTKGAVHRKLFAWRHRRREVDAGSQPDHQ